MRRRRRISNKSLPLPALSYPVVIILITLIINWELLNNQTACDTQVLRMRMKRRRRRTKLRMMRGGLERR